MRGSEFTRAVAAATSIASALGLAADEAVVLHDSNKLTVRLLPCDVVARVAPEADQIARFEVDVARRLAGFGSPVAALEPRVPTGVHELDGFVVTFWTYYEPVPGRGVPPADYATALARLHAGMRELDVPTPHLADRVEQARRLVASRDLTPALTDDDRRFLGDALRDLRRVVVERGAAEQVLHGEPHPGNVLATRNGPVFVDFETCCRGPVEFDLAHAPEEVAEHYPGVDRELLRACRVLGRAMVTAWRWDRDDRLPDGRRLGVEWLGEIREALDRDGPGAHG
ncbi:phosphotransferase enzyme family protein [Umezawaea endophytica]|uniref:Aminoglycoside phosphotransferase family protein n=1 Tax=Umezawaea endophytica TaxID=1654476 RepID=A0A9X2VKM4_9PSEU|nr:aminoglycoside phosphotransferase family protein [Umezawaea endophytica]MCS7477802.1 aminoglycoside phosphotransferase family protein [Umezawaea endophytica]